MKIAQFKNIKHGYVSIMAWPAYALHMDDFDLDGYVRVSEWADVQFVPCDSDRIVAKEVAALDQIRRAVVNDFTTQLAEIDERKAKLTAITHQVTA